MKRYAEAVLNGHPDKFCDIIADRILLEASRLEPDGYGQIEAAVWSDKLFLTGAIISPRPIALDIVSIVRTAGEEIGYRPGSHIDVNRYVIHDHICKLTGRTEDWSGFVNDQCVVQAYAGYDGKTRFLPPEQFAVWFIREKFIRACETGSLKGCGPDGKVLLIMDEHPGEWIIKKVLITLQQPDSMLFRTFLSLVVEVCLDILKELKEHDGRWQADPGQVEIIANPNGPLINGGSDGDNGQTGRKLVMDFFGPRIPIGGGALYGKHPTHIDRMATFAAREVCIDLVRQAMGSPVQPSEVNLSIAYAPGISEPLDVRIQGPVRPEHNLSRHLSLDSMRARTDNSGLNYGLEALGTFYGRTAGSNHPDQRSA